MQSKSLKYLLVILIMLFGIGQCVSAANLLMNPDFESGVTQQQWVYTGADPVAKDGWSFVIGSPGAAAIQPENSHLNDGTYLCQSGSQAMRIYGYGEDVGCSLIVYQDVVVAPSSSYTASVWVRPVDNDGKGFGTHASDSIKLYVYQWNASDEFLGATAVSETTTASTGYQNLQVPFDTYANTSYVTYTIDVVSGSGQNNGSVNGWVSIDNCSLEGPAVSASLKGTVTTTNNAPLPGVKVTLGSASVTTDSDGKYSFADLLPAAVQVKFEKDGYWTENVNFRMIGGENTLNEGMYMPPANNILANPGFESGALQVFGTNLAGATKGWQYQSLNSSFSYFYTESTMGGGMGPAEFHSGNEAQSMHTEGYGALRLYQDIPVVGNSDYTAGAWVRGTNSGTAGFGFDSSDFAGIAIEEYDESGNLLVSHDRVGVTQSTPGYQYAVIPFKTNSNTKIVRYILETHIACAYMAGRAKFDDCFLDGQIGSFTVESSGVVTSGSTPVSGATVTVKDGSGNTLGSGVTASDGKYSISWVTTTVGIPVVFRASCDGYYAASKSIVLAKNNTVDLGLAAVGTNLLVNPGFEDGYSTGWTFTNNVASESQALASFAQYNYIPHVCTGSDSMLVLVGGGGDSGSMSQTAAVKPGESYTARVNVGANSNGSGNWSWGTDPAQISYLSVQEMNAFGDAIGDPHIAYSDAAKMSPDTWQNLNLTFVSTDQTAFMKVTGYAYMVDAFYANFATAGFDDFELNGPAGPKIPLFGYVKSGSNPISGAKIIATATIDNTLTRFWATTDSSGYYSYPSLPTGYTYTVRAVAPGYYATRKTAVVGATGVGASFNLQQIDNNLLCNPNFDDGKNAGWQYKATGSHQYIDEVANVAPYAPAYIDTGEQSYSLGCDGSSGGDIYEYQVVPVAGGQEYTGTMKFVPAWKSGTPTSAWGNDNNQKAGIFVEEYDAGGTLLQTHFKYGDPTPLNVWQSLSLTITTQPNATYVKFGAYAKIMDQWKANLGRAVFDTATFCGSGPVCDSIGAAKNAEIGEAVGLQECCTTAVFNGFFYVEDADRSSGIKVLGNSTVKDIVNLYGYVTIDNGERTIVPYTYSRAGGGVLPAPVGMNNKAAFDDLPVGLYSTIWGKIDHVDSGYFTMTDGSGVSIKVTTPADFVPVETSYVRVVGIPGAEVVNETAERVFRAVSAAAILE